MELNSQIRKIHSGRNQFTVDQMAEGDKVDNHQVECLQEWDLQEDKVNQCKVNLPWEVQVVKVKTICSQEVLLQVKICHLKEFHQDNRDHQWEIYLEILFQMVVAPGNHDHESNSLEYHLLICLPNTFILLIILFKLI